MNLHQRLWQILILLLPTQLVYHFWPDWALVAGIRVDYLAPAVYLTDLLILALLASWLSHFSKHKLLKPFLFISLVGLINILVTNDWQISTFRWLKVLELFLLASYTFFNWPVLKEKLCQPLSVAVIYSGLLALAQLVNQKTIGGFLYFLGERDFSAMTPGIALFQAFDKLFLRPYATFPHPNVLAGFSLVSLILLLGQRSRLASLASGFCFLNIFICFSQNVWLTSLVIFVWWLLARKIRPKAFYLIFLVAIFVFSLVMPIVAIVLFSSDLNFDQSIYQRLSLSIGAMVLLPQSLVLGIGLGNFITLLPNLYQKLPNLFVQQIFWWLQPVHNIFLLVLVETGMVGFLAFFFLLAKALKTAIQKKAWRLIGAFGVIILTGFFDHYWLTLQQTQLLFAIVVGAMYAKSYVSDKNLL